MEKNSRITVYKMEDCKFNYCKVVRGACLRRGCLGKDLKKGKQLAMGVLEQSTPSEENSQCQGPRVGLVKEQQGRNSKEGNVARADGTRKKIVEHWRQTRQALEAIAETWAFITFNCFFLRTNCTSTRSLGNLLYLIYSNDLQLAYKLYIKRHFQKAPKVCSLQQYKYLFCNILFTLSCFAALNLL